ncbi:hypothetical protein PIB30_023471 [Stylosanthes scabra]|uniref:Uncharacterized protein n=1 Tax=Stylosanthes scabra TaxID=79078 RepID=A0ABU6R9Y6_9FABA|nr:hypothetical protein [Stylosanthes scabra]
MLLSTCLFGDKTGAWAHVRWLPYLLRIDDLGRYSQQECRPGGRAVGSAAELDFLAVSGSSALRFRRHRVAIGLQVFPHIRREEASTAGSQEAARFDALLRVCLSPVSDSGGRGLARSIHSAGGSQGPLMLDRPTYIPWDHRVTPDVSALACTLGNQVLEVVQFADPGPTADFIQWWIIAATRYLVPADHFHRLPPDEIPVETTQRQLGPHPARPNVSHVPDNRRPGRRMMIGMRTTARDWQWLDEIMANDAPAEQPTQKIRCMPESYARRRGTSRPRRGGRAGRGHRERVTRRLPSRLKQAFLDGLSSLGFQQMISDIMLEGSSGYMPDTQFDVSQVHLDLNEPVSGPSHLCMALGGTPPSAAHVPGGSWEVPFMELPVYRLLQHHLHRLRSQTSQ